MQDSMSDFLSAKRNSTFELNSLKDESTATTDKLLSQIIILLEKLVNKNTSPKYNSGPTNLPNAVIVRPTDPDNVNPTTGYTQLLIKQTLGRSPDIIYLVNNGPGTIYAISATNSTTFSQSEYVISEGDRGTFYNVDEIRLRTTSANTEYIATENELIRPKNIPFPRGNPYVSQQILAPAGTRTENIFGSTVPPLGIGRNALIGAIINDGPGAMNLEWSYDGVTFALVYTMLPTELLNLTDVHTLRLTNVAGGNIYRMYVK